MSRFTCFGLVLGGLFFLGIGLHGSTQNGPKEKADPKKKEDPKVVTDNKNTLLLKYKGKLKFSCSTFWPQWEVEKAFDGNLLTSWFSAKGDAAAFGKKPWVQVTFPEDVTVRRITVLGNREPAWLKGYTILAGSV
jgi:hypothetical protein